MAISLFIYCFSFQLCASDVVFAVTALLENSTVWILFYLLFPSLFCLLNELSFQEEEKTFSDNFLDALDALTWSS